MSARGMMAKGHAAGTEEWPQSGVANSASEPGDTCHSLDGNAHEAVRIEFLCAFQQQLQRARGEDVPAQGDRQ